MRKLTVIPLLFLSLLFFQCGKKQDDSPMWIFSDHSTAEQVEERLATHRILQETMDTVINSNRIKLFYGDKYIIEYLGSEWGIYSVGFVNDSLSFVSLTRGFSHEEGISDYELNIIINSLDSIYGNHRIEAPEGYGPFDDKTKNWTWVKGNVNVRFFCTDAVSKNDVFGLEFVNGDPRKIEKIFVGK